MKVLKCKRHLTVFIEFDALYRLGIPDPAGYIKKRYKSTQLLFLRAACVGREIVDQVEASVEEAISSGNWIDVAVSNSFCCCCWIYLCCLIFVSNNTLLKLHICIMEIPCCQRRIFSLSRITSKKALFHFKLV